MGEPGESRMDVEESGHKGVESRAPSPAEEEAIMKKKYGGRMPKKPPLISKDHERAFFDSADWALGKGGAPPGQKPRTLMETLRPKLQPTPHQSLPSRRSSLLPADGEGEGWRASKSPSYDRRHTLENRAKDCHVKRKKLPPLKERKAEDQGCTVLKPSNYLTLEILTHFYHRSKCGTEEL